MKIRKSQPKNNKYYIRKPQGGLSDAVYGKPTIKGANVLCNCVGYAGSRFNEIINDPNLNGTVKAFKYQLVCNAEDFIESAKKQGLKISETPIEGGIMVWAKGRVGVDSDGAGHVAVVEEVYEDGTILTSESGWNAWAFKTITRSNANGRWGQSSAYKFRGCIINPSVKNPKVVPMPKLVVDGIGGEATIRATQRYFGTPIDGIISGQSKAQKKYYPSIVSVEFGSGGSAVVKKLQKWCKVTQDGILGKNTVKAWQKKIGVEADGIFGVKSMKAWQKYLNAKLYSSDKAEQTTQKEEQTATTPQFTTPKGVYQFIDVSDWQDKIDWSKVKKSGVVGAIIRYADGDTLDKRFAENMKNATAAGLHIGAYIFSRAKTKAEAEKEAERLFNACKPYKPDMPMYIDLEAKGLEKYADTVAIAFLSKMASLGGRGGVYANLNWWNNYLKKTASDYSANPFWIAQYNTTMDYKPASLMGMWQYSSSGKVDGISGKVDMDYCYVAYWESKEKKSSNAEKIAECADKFAYPTNTAEANWPDGKPTDAYKNGLNEAYPNRSSWGKSPRAGASCDVFVGTCVRCAGVDKDFPRGLSPSYLAKSDKFKQVSVSASTIKDGDIIVTSKHICIHVGGKIKEASHDGFYPKTTDTLKKRLSANGAKVYRAK